MNNSDSISNYLPRPTLAKGHSVLYKISQSFRRNIVLHSIKNLITEWVSFESKVQK